jgi:histidinol phosphatase-like enzyme
MGMPAAGKSLAARDFVAAGYHRLNRDQRGGRLRDLIPELEKALAQGSRRFVLDNTYGSRAERQRVVEAAARLGLPARCVWLTTPLEEAQVNAVLRTLERHGRLLEPDEILAESRKDPGILGPGALFRFRRSFEPPEAEEGFRELEQRAFVRRWQGERAGRALVVEYDGVLRRSRRGDRAPRHADDVEVPEAAGPALRAWAERGHRLLGTAWYPEVAAGVMSASDLEAVMRRTHELLGIELEWLACTHPPGPPVCWCRKPLPGLLVAWIERHRLDPGRCLLVGPSAADRTLAARLGVPFMAPAALLAGADATPNG